MKKIIIVVAVLISGLGLTACTTTSGVSQSEFATLQKQVQHLQDLLDIKKLQSKYAHLLFTHDFDRIFAECYAQNRDDISIEFSDSGIYKGPESVKALYDAFAVAKQIPGFFILHMSTNPYIEIASDGMSARSHWLSPGATATPSRSSWVWGPYYVDYVKENGEWRILHSNLAPLFRTPYEKSWTEAEDHGTVLGILPVEADEPPTLYRPYNEVKKETDIFKRHPELPEPYEGE